MEGPSLVILREELKQFHGKNVRAIAGNANIAQHVIVGKRLKHATSWGKHLLLQFPRFYLRIHFLMFGSYRINETKELPPRLLLSFSNGDLNLYSCAVGLYDGDATSNYDYSLDLFSTKWNRNKVLKLIRDRASLSMCDLLLDQNVFPGVGNIIKNEVLFRISLSPLATSGELSPRRRGELVTAVHRYYRDFYQWKKAFELKKNWQVYRKKVCPRCGEKLRMEKTGVLARVSFYCDGCQSLT